jgi:hypothetical protein
MDNNFLNRTLIAQEIEQELTIRMVSDLSCTSKDTIARMKRQPIQMGENLCLFSKGLMSRLYEELKKLNTKRINPISKWANELNRQYSKEVHMANKYMKCLTSLVMKEIISK